MSKIICPCGECVHNGKNYICKAEKVEFKWRNMATINEGRVDMWVCKQYELSDCAQEIISCLKDINHNKKARSTNMDSKFSKGVYE